MPSPRGVVVEFADRPPTGPLRQVIDTLRSVLGKMVSLADVAMVMEAAGLVTAAAAASPGTSVPVTRVFVDFAEAGVDQVRLVAYGKNSGAGSVTIALYDVTNAVTLATVVLTGVAAATYAGAWVSIKPSGSDQELELRVVGAGETPTLYAVHAQMRTLQARK
jgi:hypothetical protein